MNISKKDIQAFIENFNKDFNVKLKNDNTTFLIDLFENFVSLYMSSANSKNLKKLEELEKLEEEINKNYNEQDKKLFDRWNKLQDNLFSKEIQQAFIYGVCICRRLDEEIKITGGEK